MAQKLASRLESFLEERTDGHLRSIVIYDEGDFRIDFIRDDVAEQYSEHEIEAAIIESRLESMEVPLFEDLFADDHGELTCLVKCYENVIEMNFVLDDAVGAAVALDAEALGEATGIVADARDIVFDER